MAISDPLHRVHKYRKGKMGVIHMQLRKHET